MGPGHTKAGEVDLIGSDLLVAELIGGDTKETAELRDRVHVGLLGCWREVTNRRVVKKPPTERGHLSHHKVSCLMIGVWTTAILLDRRHLRPRLLLLPR
jgi:hypothetical protein